MEAVLFDLDGVLIDSYDTWFHLMNAAAREFDNPQISREAFADCWGQGVHEDVRRFYPQKSVAELEEYYEAHFMAHREHLRIDPDTGLADRDRVLSRALMIVGGAFVILSFALFVLFYS